MVVVVDGGHGDEVVVVMTVFLVLLAMTVLMEDRCRSVCCGILKI